MKQKKLDKKLPFSKTTIADLENKEMEEIKGASKTCVSFDPLTLIGFCCIQEDPSRTVC